MSVNDEREYPWLKQEKAFIKEAVDRWLRELVAGEYIQTEQALRAVPDDVYLGINSLMNDVLPYITRFHTTGNP